ncbi:MAG: hypothetical protein ACAI34_16545 [Verrucomicrobium sp.]|nr:hypothetical protein [Verrucomicrobium sp.]
MTQCPPPGYHLEMGLWAVELVVLVTFAVRCFRSLSRRQPWISSQLLLIFAAFSIPITIAWLRLDQLYQRPSFPDVEYARARLWEIQFMFILGAFKLTCMVLMHSIAWLVSPRSGHNPPLSDNLNPIPQ